MKTFNKTTEQETTVAISTKNAADSGQVYQTANKTVGMRSQDSPTGPASGGELMYKERTVGMATRALKGPAAITLFLSSFPKVTRIVTCIDPTVANQFMRNKPTAFARAITDGFISTRKKRDSTDPSPGL